MSMDTPLIERFTKRGSDFLGVKHPILCGAMTWVSEPGLVAAVCNAGGFASLAGGNAPIEILRAQIEETRRLTDKPFGVNLITIAPAYKAQLQLCRDMALPYVPIQNREIEPLRIALQDVTVQDNVAEGNEMIDVNGRQRHVIGYLKDFLFSLLDCGNVVFTYIQGCPT